MFFERYPRFYDPAGLNVVRKNLRHEAIIGQNHDVFAGARVLDLASSKGSWSMAALEAGAAHVIGVEARADKVDDAREHFIHYGVEADRYRFIAGDLIEVMARERFDVDIVLCLGFMYHTLRYPELMHHIRSTGAETLIIDTEVAISKSPFVRLMAETVEAEGNAAPDRYSRDDVVLVGRPSLAALETVLGVYGFAIEQRSDWAAILRDNDPPPATLLVYAEGRRVTIRCRAVG